MYINTQKGLIFGAHPRTASRAVAHVLRHQCEFIKVGSHHGLRDETGRYNEYDMFVVVRNHWDTIVSWHGGFAPEGHPLTVKWIESWVRLHQYYFPLPRLFWMLDEDPVWVLRYEELGTSLPLLLEDLGFGQTTLTVIGESERNPRRGRHYSEIMTEDVADWVYSVFRDEIEELGYAYESMPVL